MFAGCVSENAALREELLALSRRPEGLGHIPFDDRGAFADGNVVLVQQRPWNTAESKQESGVIAHVESKTRICAWARIDNREELLSKLPEDLRQLAATDTGLILAAYLRFGSNLCEHLIGDFAFAIHDGRDGAVTLGRDHVGVRPLYYAWNGKDFVFATSLAVLDGLRSLELSDEWLARYVLGCSQDWMLTPYRDASKVPPGHVVSFKPGAEPQARRYFEFSSEADLKLDSDEEYVEAYRKVLREAVKCRVRSAYPIGSESSGGLDASTCTSLASSLMENPARDLHAFGFANCEQEPDCILAVSQKWPLRATHMVTGTASVKRDSTEQLQQFWNSNGAPIEHANGLSHFPFYEQGQKWGLRTLLSGFGGDEFVTNHGALARVEFLRAGEYRKLARTMPRNPLFSWLRALKWIRKYYRTNNTFEVAQALMAGAAERWEARIVADRHATPEMKELATRGARYDSGCRTQNEFALTNRWSPNMTARLENCTLMAATYGIEYRWPLMDVRLLKFFLSVPAEQKFGPGGVSRYLHRRAVADIIPAKIAWKDKCMGDSAITWKPPQDQIGKNFKRPAFADLHPTLQSVLDERRFSSLAARLRPGATEWVDRQVLQSVTGLNTWLKFRDGEV